MLACNEVTRLWASEEIRSATLARRIAVRMHLMMCRHCRRYVRELALIGEGARVAAEASTDDAIRERLERRLRGESAS